jgi:hypothetical protein
MYRQHSAVGVIIVFYTSPPLNDSSTPYHSTPHRSSSPPVLPHSERRSQALDTLHDTDSRSDERLYSPILSAWFTFKIVGQCRKIDVPLSGSQTLTSYRGNQGSTVVASSHIRRG